MFLTALRSPFLDAFSRDGFELAGGFSPITLFSASQQGAWYDPSDFSTLFQDLAGATSVTAVEQPVGLMRDKSGRNNHASQITAASRPIVSARVNLLVKTEDFTDVAWVKASGIAPPVKDASGPLTLITYQAGFDNLTQNFTAPSTAVSCSVLVKASGNSASPRQFLLRNGTSGVNFDVATFDLASSVLTGTGWTASNLGGGLFRLSYSKATGINVGDVLIVYVGGTGAPVAAADVGKSFFAGAVQAEVGTTATRYQRVNTTSDYDTAGFPMFGKTDGVDDSMTSATGGGGTAGFFFCQAIKPTGGAGAVRTLWSDSGTNSGYRVQLNASNQLSLSAGNGTAYTTAATATATSVGITHLLTVWDDGTNLNVQLDSGAVATIARPVVTAGTAGFTIGKDNGAATGFFTGNMYPEVYRQTSLTAAERSQVQAYVRSKAGI